MQPEIASEFFSQKWNKPITGYQIIKSMCKIKSSGIKKMFKELPVLIRENEVTKAMNYLDWALQLIQLQQKLSSIDYSMLQSYA